MIGVESSTAESQQSCEMRRDSEMQIICGGLRIMRRLHSSTMRGLCDQQHELDTCCHAFAMCSLGLLVCIPAFSYTVISECFENGIVCLHTWQLCSGGTLDISRDVKKESENNFAMLCTIHKAEFNSFVLTFVGAWTQVVEFYMHISQNP